MDLEPIEHPKYGVIKVFSKSLFTEDRFSSSHGVRSILKTDEFRIILAAALFIALPSIVLSIVALVVLARESRLTDERFREAHVGSVERALGRTLSALREAEEEAELAGKEIARRPLVGEDAWARVSQLLGPDRVFREAYLVDREGKVLFPDVAPELDAPPPEWAPEPPEATQALVRDAVAKEFAQDDPVRASRAWRMLREECEGLEGAAAQRLSGSALFGEARCEKKAGRVTRAILLFRMVYERHRGVWGEGNIPLAPAALMELARCGREAGDEGAFRDAWMSLGAFLGRNEALLSRTLLGFFLDELRGSGVPGALEAFKAVQARRAARASFLARFGEALCRGPSPQGYVASAASSEYAFFVPLHGGGEDSGNGLHAALFLPDRSCLIARFRQWSEEVRLEDEVRVLLVTPEGRPVESGVTVPEGFKPIAEKAFPEPLSDWRVALFMEKVVGVQALWVLRWSLTLWVILVAAMAVAGGTVFVVRAVNREIRLAREKADFVSSVTHELKTPLTSIRMFTETLMMERVHKEEEKRECLRVIAGETDRLSRLINRMLDFSKMERGLRRFQFREEEPGSILREAVQAFRAQGEGLAEVTVQVLDPLPPVRCDRDAVIEVLLNLISNAVKYNRDGAPVTARLWASRGRVKVAVMDRGIGIPKSELKKVFEKFYRVDESLTKEVEGCGLGLSISSHIARAHGGSIAVESEPGRGSIFTLVLPESGPKGG